ncbi:MAG: arylsulfatase [Verrucomicrobia bacterium]|nr:arylsulfatase [Verrucomicrobiota bacterium]
MKNPFVKVVALLVGISVCGAIMARAADPGVARPNILFIITDDQGYGDISAHGNPVLKTPHLDALRAQSVRFTDFQVSPTCAPTRSAIMTGRHEFKNGVTHTILERERLTLTATTLAEVLKSAGYSTGIFGKWHLGDEAAYQPGRRGFDEVFIHGGGGIGQTYPGSCGDAPGNTYFDPAILHNGVFEKTKGYCTDVFFAQATKWIEGAKARGGPFFAYVATNAPHAPYTARPEDAALYRGKAPDEATANFFGMIHNIDENVGRLLAKLDEWGIARDTLVVFMNDNGGVVGTKVFNAGMRAQKGTPWLGGVRAASFWRWPARWRPADVAALAAHIDIFPTLAEITGAKLNEAARAQVEGRSLVPLLEQREAPWGDRVLFTHVGRWAKGSDPALAKYRNCAARDARWKIVAMAGGATPQWQLFDLPADPGEQRDVAKEHPEVVSRLAAGYEAWWREVRPMMVNEEAAGPRYNPFKEIYWKQFGVEPTAEDLRAMDPKREFPEGGGAKKKKS